MKTIEAKLYNIDQFEKAAAMIKAAFNKTDISPLQKAATNIKKVAHRIATPSPKPAQ